MGFFRVFIYRFALPWLPCSPASRPLFLPPLPLSLDLRATTRASFHIEVPQVPSGCAVVSRPPFHGSLTHPNAEVNFMRTIRHIFSASSSSIDPSPPFLERRRFWTCHAYRRPRPPFGPRFESYHELFASLDPLHFGTTLRAGAPMTGVGNSLK